MPRKCSVRGCKSNYDSQRGETRVTVYGFPRRPDHLRQWLAALPNAIEPSHVTNHMGICAHHFLPNTPMVRRGRHLVPCLTPTVFNDFPDIWTAEPFRLTIKDWEEAEAAASGCEPSMSVKLECFDESTPSSPNDGEFYKSETPDADDAPEGQQAYLKSPSVIDRLAEKLVSTQSERHANQHSTTTTVATPHQNHTQPLKKRKRDIEDEASSSHSHNAGENNKNLNNSNSHYDSDPSLLAMADTVVPDNNSIFATNVGSKLRLMTREQRIYAERLINEALFYGELGHLNIHSRIVIDGDRVVVKLT